MSKDNGVRLPSSGSGLISYSSDYKSKIHLKPSFVIVLAVVIIVVVLLMHTF